jgi:hypothetical protein
MKRASRTNPRLQEKLDALQRELARVETDIKGISRAVEGSNPDQVARTLRRVNIEPVTGDVPVARTIMQGVPSKPMDEMDDISLPKPVADQRFTTYFGSGSLHSVRPLRQERRVQRNKAVVMLILAALILYGVIKMMF